MRVEAEADEIAMREWDRPPDSATLFLWALFAYAEATLRLMQAGCKFVQEVHDAVRGSLPALRSGQEP